MRIRTKFLAVILVELLGFAALSGLSLATFARVRTLRSVVDQGIGLVSRSRRVYSQLKDVVFDLFTPVSYQSLRSVVLAPRSLVTGRELAHETGLLRGEYDAFIADSRASGLMGNPGLREVYQTGSPLAEKAFLKLGDLSALIERLRVLYPDSDTDLYLTIQESGDESLYAVFGEIRDSSFYLNNIFESYLTRFVQGTVQEADRLERSASMVLAAAVLFLGGLTVVLIYALSTSIIASIGTMEAAMARVAAGDFSVRVPMRSKDELGGLAKAFDRLAGDLKRNVESIPSILKDVNEVLPDDPDLPRILSLITDALLKEGGAQGVSVFMRSPESPGELEFAACSGLSPLPGVPVPSVVPGPRFAPILPDGSGSFMRSGTEVSTLGIDPAIAAILVVPLTVRRKTAGYCVFTRADRAFTDLEVSRLSASADYAAQVAENVAANAALSARRDAEFLALQSQIRPHFLYNILNSLMALNRMGDSGRLEESVIALKGMLRYTLEHGLDATVAEEFEFLGRYCDLQKLRHQDRFDFRVEADADVGDMRIPKLIVQPLVENALIHGLEPKRGPGRLSVTARREEGLLRIVVEDDGVGCEPARLVADGRSRVGLGNVRRRLELIGHGARLELSGAPEAGFMAEVSIPLEALDTLDEEARAWTS